MLMENTIKIDFTISNGVYSYTDCLHLPANHTYTEEQLQAMKQERFDRWVDAVTNPPPVVIPTIGENGQPIVNELTSIPPNTNAEG
jgi:hypothetical protein